MEDVYQHSVKQWWLSLTAGVIYIALGLWVLLNPITSYVGLVTLFILGFGVIGILTLYYAINNRKRLQHWGWSLMAGIADIAIAFLLINRSELTIFVLPLYIGFILMFRSIIGIGFSAYLAQFKVRNWWVVLALSILGVVFSVILIWEPRIAAFGLVVYMGVALLSAGFAQVGIAYELRRYDQLMDDEEEAAAAEMQAKVLEADEMM